MGVASMEVPELSAARRLAFRFIVGVLIVLFAGALRGAASLVTGWTDAARPHNVHDLAAGALLIFFISVGLLVQWRKPLANVAAFQMALITALVFAAALAVTGDAAGLVFLIPLGVAAAVHPRRQLITSTVAGVSAPLAAIALVSAVPLIVYAISQLRLELEAPPGDPHAAYHHYAATAALALCIVFVGLLTSLRTPGFALAGFATAAAAAYLGVASVAFPASSSSLGRAWGVIAIGAALCFALMTEWERRSGAGRRSRRSSGHVASSWTRALSYVLMVALAVPALVWHAPASAGASPNRAAALRWPGYVETDLKFSEFFEKNHTLVARFMLQYPRAYSGPIVSAKAGPQYFSIGQGTYDDKLGFTKLVLRLDGVKPISIPFPDDSSARLRSGRWYHLAIVHKEQVVGNKRYRKFEIFLDGKRACLGSGLCGRVFSGPVGSTIIGPATPPGALRIGRGVAEHSGTEQFYGLVDDVAVFRKALTPGQVYALSLIPRISGTETGLLAGFTFDTTTPDGGALPARLSRPITFVEGAVLVEVSSKRNSKVDRAKLPLPNPFIGPAMQLPFKPGQVWKVLQGFATKGSHNGKAAFAWDFVLVGEQSREKDVNPNNPGDPSCGEPVFASAPGDLVYKYDDGGGKEDASDPKGDVVNDDFDGPNRVLIQQARHSFASYMHLFTDSVDEAFAEVDENAFPPSGDPFPVPAGRQLGTVGTRNSCHLHFGVTNGLVDSDDDGVGDESKITYPVNLWDYDVCRAMCEYDEMWEHVPLGVPRKGDLIRGSG